MCTLRFRINVVRCAYVLHALFKYLRRPLTLTIHRNSYVIGMEHVAHRLSIDRMRMTYIAYTAQSCVLHFRSARHTESLASISCPIAWAPVT